MMKWDSPSILEIRHVMKLYKIIYTKETQITKFTHTNIIHLCNIYVNYI